MLSSVAVVLAAALCASAYKFGEAIPRDVVDAHYTRTPAGYVLSHCVYNVESGTHVYRDETGLHARQPTAGVIDVPPCVGTHEGEPLPTVYRALPSDYNGWLAYVAFNYSAGFDSYLGNFTVPNIPASNPEVIYLFTGLQNIDWIPKVDPESQGKNFDIIQPVLQFPGDNGRYWSVKSWYVTLDGGSFASTEVKVRSGDYIFGNMTQTGSDTWYIGSTAGSTGATTHLTQSAARLESQLWAYNVLEGYGVTGCDDYPTNTCEFSDLILTSRQVPLPDADLNWVIDPKPNPHLECGEKLVINSPTDMTISFQK
eukprot:m.309207 g.309207  ORF g.309207 m.309207 type:complete len:312 (+) comp55342_c0_seq1:28-963(+)